MPVLWQLRFRSPAATTKGVDDVTISTKTADPLRARAVADYWLSKAMPHPNTTFVFLRPVVVQTEEDMEKELAAGQAPAAATTAGGGDPAAGAARGGSVVGGVEDPASKPKGRVGQ